MGLKKKTFLYSFILAVIMIAFIIGYFILMLPSLYVDYVMNSNLDSVIQVQQNYMKDRTYDNLTVRNPSMVVSLEVPKEGEEVYLEGKFFRLTVRIRDEELQEFLDNIRAMAAWGGFEMADLGEIDFSVLESLWSDRLKEKFTGKDFLPENYPVKIEMERKTPKLYQDGYIKGHFVSDDILVYESGSSDGNYSYTTYIAVGWAEDAMIMTFMSTMTPGMEEITPVVWESLPMIVSVIFLVVLVSSRFFSGRIVNPIIRLADCAQSAGESGCFEENGFGGYGQTKGAGSRMDEIGVLGKNLQELYGKLRDNYEELEQKNRLLEEENERQELFLRASSHQLKTPVAAALLLIEGMMNEVGKYKDAKAYLPEVKKQLLSMRKIVEDILYLNHCAGRMQIENVDLETLAEELVRGYLVQADSRGLYINIEGKGIVAADREMLSIIVDNLLSNAVQYTPDEQRIVVKADTDGLCITNYGVTIDEKLLPNILEPFVSSDTDRKGKGLGLYVASYYSRRMGCMLDIRNIENGVQAKVIFCKRKARTPDQECHGAIL